MMGSRRNTEQPKLEKTRGNGHVLSMASLLEEKVIEVKPPHPFDSIFGAKVNEKIQSTKTFGLTF